MHHRCLIGEVLLLLIFFKTLVIIALDVSSNTIPCPSSCKCNPSENNEISNLNHKNAVDKRKLMANCWIPANLNQLQCSPEWDILHLQVLNTKSNNSTIQSSPSSPKLSPVGNHSTEFLISKPVSLSSDLFAACGSVTRMAIWERSQFTTFPKYILQPMVNLTRLVIQVPSLQTLPDQFLAFLPKLNLVMISKCSRLQLVRREVFEPCPTSLHTMWLTNNGLKGKLQARLFQHCVLKNLWLNENQIEQLDWDSLRGLTQLKHLRLNQNRLNGSLAQCLGYRDDMKSTVLNAVPLLKTLDLSHNNLTTIEGSQWCGRCELGGRYSTGLCYLEELNLDFNRLLWIGSDAFTELPSLKKLTLHGNLELYTADSLTSLTLALFYLSLKETHLNTLSLTVPITDKSWQRKLQARQRDVFNACKPNPNLLAHFPRSLGNVLTKINQTSCHQMHVSIKQSSNNYQLIPVTPDEQQVDLNHTLVTEVLNTSLAHKDPFLNFFRQANKFNLFLFSLLLLLFGVLFGLIPFIYLACSLKHKSKTNKSKLKYYSSPMFIHPSQVNGYIGALPEPDGSVPSPLPVRTHHPSALPTPQRPAVPAPPHCRMPKNKHSVDELRMRPLPPIQMDLTSRRVNSTSNVGQRNLMNGFLHGSSHVPRNLFNNNNSPQRNARAIRLTEMRPLITPSNGILDSVYNPTVETTLGGSTYSLATITSLNPRSPKALRLIPTGHQAVV